MSKRVQISPDNGSTWYTFPGDKADFQDQASDIKDTIFGQDYESGQTGMLGWSLSCNGIYKGFAGYVAKIKKSGTATAFTTEAFTLVSGKTYKITDITKNVWNRAGTFAVFDNAVAVDMDDDIESIDYLNGRITFASAYTVGGPVTVTGSYFPMTQLAGANSFTLTQNANAIDTTDYVIAQGNGGYRTFIYGLKTVKLSVKGIFSAGAGFRALLQARPELMIEINPDGSNMSVARGWFKPLSTSQAGNVGELEDSSIDFSLSVPDQEGVAMPYGWAFDAATTLSRAVREALISWTTGTVVDVNYLHDGTNGYKGDAVVTDISLSGGLDVMNDFSIKLQGSGATAAHP